MALNFTYPEHLEEDAYKYRHIKIIAKKSSVEKGTAAETLQAVLKKGSEISDTIIDSSLKIIGSTDTNEILQNSVDMTNNMKTAMAGTYETLGTFTLPLPNEFTESISHDFNTEEGVSGTLYKNFSDMGSMGFTVDKSIGMLSNATGTRKPLADPGYWQNYTGTQPREFSFNFDFIPHNSDDAAYILGIITAIKNFSLPTTALNGVAILAPYFFSIELTNPYIDSMIKMQDVVLTNMEINYGADGNMQQMAVDGMPKHIQMTLNFRDKKMLYSGA